MIFALCFAFLPYYYNEWKNQQLLEVSAALSDSFLYKQMQSPRQSIQLYLSIKLLSPGIVKQRIDAIQAVTAIFQLNGNVLPNMNSSQLSASDQFRATNSPVRIGYSTFNAKNSIIYYEQEISHSVASAKTWKIKDYYKPYGWSEAISDMQETNVQEIQAQQSTSNVLLDICHIRFHLLRSIDLNSNHITSIEPMVHMHLPNIESISLANNYITNINSLAKINLSKVNNLDLTNNLVQEASKLRLSNAKASSLNINLPICCSRLSILFSLTLHNKQTKLFCDLLL